MFEASDDPAAFQDALVYQMRRFGESYWQLYRAAVRLDETFDHKTLLSWLQGERVPRSVASFEILARIERRYRLPAGYFKAKLPDQTRSLLGHDLGDISPAERRRISLHLPDNFSSLPFSKREEILDWVRRIIISGSADYRRYQAAASKQHYAIRFPGVTYGGGSLSPRVSSLTAGANNNAQETLEDPDLLSGIVDALPRLAMEMADLIRFNTSTLTAIGFQRKGAWGKETASQKIGHLGLMLGALAASPAGIVKGRGVPLKRTGDLGAYDLDLRSLPLFNAYTRKGFAEAETFLRTALRHDPNYVDALAALADCVDRMALNGWVDDVEKTYAESCGLAERAVLADPEHPGALATAAWASAMFGEKFERASDLAERALALHPDK